MAGSYSLSTYILKNLDDRKARFVFPSAVPATFWTEFAAESALGAVAKDRFIAWDDFKAGTLAAERLDRRPANGAVRSIFAASLLAENAAAASSGSPLFTELIAGDHAETYGAFVASLALSLPALDGLVSRAEAARLVADDPYFTDLALVRSRYAAFLDQYGLFEPSWNRVPFRAGAFRWLLVCPELAEDWNEYEAELTHAEAVDIVRLWDLVAPQENPVAASAGTTAERRAAGARAVLTDAVGHLLTFGSAHEEIRWITLAVRRLLEGGVLAPSDIVISIPNVQDYAERLLLEFRLRDVPADLREGRSIAEQPVGRFFSALAACPATRWSYRALKDLLLDAALPWKDRSAIDALMEFGLRYRCVSGFPENGRNVDVWERTFERLWENPNVSHMSLKPIQDFYRKLKSDVMFIAKASSFRELHEHLQKFKTNHFDETALDADINLLLAKSLDALKELANTEERLEGMKVDRPFDLFRTHLRGLPYVFQGRTPGVRIYKYRVSALIQPAVHIIANATQDAATVRANPAPFLREDRKLRARVDERDMSGDFITAYALSGETVVFTASSRGFTTHSVPHRSLGSARFRATEGSWAAGKGPDPLQLEVDLALGRSAAEPAAQVLCAPTPLQNRAREVVEKLAGGSPPLDIRRSPLRDAQAAAALRAKLTRSEDGDRVSPTGLNEFGSCAYSWFLRRGLGIKEKQTEIETIDQRELGTLYHRILQRLFDRIQKEDARFRQEHLSLYKDFLVEEADAALEEARSSEGAFQESVYAMLRHRLIAALSAYLDVDAPRLDSCAVLGAEYPLKRAYPELGLALSGIADLVLRNNDGTLAVVDFKTGLMPDVAALIPDDEGLLGDFQMASYVRMAESGEETVRTARFYSIDNRKFRHVLADDEKTTANSRLPLTRDEYEGALKAVDEAMEAAAGSLDGAAYPVPPPGYRAACATCKVLSVCRLPFAGGEP